MILGVIPAAGKATRWGGVYKEMLPISKGKLLIDHTIETMVVGGADAILIISNPEKVGALVHHVSGRYKGIQIYYAIQRGGNDILSAIAESFGIPADTYLFAMPDTLYPPLTFTLAIPADFIMGLFDTDDPERFGTLRRGQIVNKEPGDDELYKAWGTLVWSGECVRFWQENPPENYTDAINRAIDEYGLHSIEMDYYHDMATFEDFKEWLSL